MIDRARDPAWVDGTRVTILPPHPYAGETGQTVDWAYAFASESRRYWVELDEDLSRCVIVHESELQIREPS